MVIFKVRGQTWKCLWHLGNVENLSEFVNSEFIPSLYTMLQTSSVIEL